MEFVVVDVNCKSIKWCVWTISEHDSQWTNSFNWVDLGSLHEKYPQDGDEDGSICLYEYQQWDVGRARSLQSIPYVIELFNSDDADEEEEYVGCRQL